MVAGERISTAAMADDTCVQSPAVITSPETPPVSAFNACPMRSVQDASKRIGMVDEVARRAYGYALCAR